MSFSTQRSVLHQVGEWLGPPWPLGARRRSHIMTCDSYLSRVHTMTERHVYRNAAHHYTDR